MALPCVSPREEELANDVLCRWIPAGTETLPQPVHRCLILFLLTSQSQADSGKMAPSSCGETENLCLPGVQPHHMFSESPRQVLPCWDRFGAAAPQPCSLPVLLGCAELSQSLWPGSWLFVLPQTPVAPCCCLYPFQKTLHSRCWLMQEVLEKCLWKVDFKGFLYVCVQQVQLFSVRIK